MSHPAALCQPDDLLDRLSSTAERVDTDSDGRRVAWRIWGQGKPVLCLHGGSGSWKHWVRSIEPLAKGNRVLVPDLPGYGDSDEPAEPTSVMNMARDVTAGLDSLIGPDTPYAIAAFSFGGAMTAQLLQLHANRIRGLFLCSPAGIMAPNPPPTAKVRGKSGDELVEAHRFNLGSIMLADPALVDARTLRIQHENTVQARLNQLKVKRGKLLPEVLDGFTGPVVSIWGEKDAFVAPGTMETRVGILRDAYPAAEIEVLDGAGHWVNYEAAERINQMLLDFLARLD
ncbi:alpha/beta fold hydrolase [Oceanicola sp. 22II-s10i]|uniref:alpha/beta fold hydrolase n=1 Tax=Oceanicola sp. 22II-s10i TaxID=1317116 RepID=UPI0015958E2B|nr:alpha/beta fold hydrolase [Oceanicola sp. 22II-s10i]